MRQHKTNLHTRIEQASKQHESVGLLFIDLAGFKAVNDALGHAVGDELLQACARRLASATGTGTHAGRWRGDEFVVIIDRVDTREDAAAVARQVLTAFSEKFYFSAGSRLVGVSIGISCFPFPDDGMDPATLVQHADIALYAAKINGGGTYRFFEQHLHRTVRLRMEREMDLMHAIETDQFDMYYQPRVDIRSGKITSMEALIRWYHPIKGQLGPSEFIPLAEENGMILRLGRLSVEKVCAQLAQWQRKGQPLVPVSINVSSRELNELDVAGMIHSAVKRHQIEPALIEVEVTESAVVKDYQHASMSTSALRALGIMLALDDFGTGYSSLSQLQHMHFDVLKIDQSFITRMDKGQDGEAFVAAIIAMARALRMRTVAEGVETSTQFEMLKALGCHEAQGYYLSRALPATELEQMLATWNVKA